MSRFFEGKFFREAIHARGAGMGFFALAVREAGASRHNWGAIKGPPKPPRCIITRGVSGETLNWAPMIPRSASLSDV